MSQKQKTKDVKRSKKKKSHENYLKGLFNRHGHSLVLNSNREAPGNKHWTEISARGTLND
jgi:hypothetical protein